MYVFGGRSLPVNEIGSLLSGNPLNRCSAQMRAFISFTRNGVYALCAYCL
ncbi:hypothetical protein PGB90_001990 [Kerria lacca]